MFSVSAFLDVCVWHFNFITSILYIYIYIYIYVYIYIISHTCKNALYLNEWVALKRAVVAFKRTFGELNFGVPPAELP